MKTLVKFWSVHYCKDHTQKEYKVSFKTWQLPDGSKEYWIVENDNVRIVTEEEGNEYFRKLKAEFMYKFVIVEVVNKLDKKRLCEQ